MGKKGQRLKARRRKQAESREANMAKILSGEAQYQHKGPSSRWGLPGRGR